MSISYSDPVVVRQDVSDGHDIYWKLKTWHINTKTCLSQTHADTDRQKHTFVDADQPTDHELLHIRPGLYGRTSWECRSTFLTSWMFFLLNNRHRQCIEGILALGKKVTVVRAMVLFVPPTPSYLKTPIGYTLPASPLSVSPSSSGYDSHIVTFAVWTLKLH